MLAGLDLSQRLCVILSIEGDTQCQGCLFNSSALSFHQNCESVQDFLSLADAAKHAFMTLLRIQYRTV
jgi:hypothetical protein